METYLSILASIGFVGAHITAAILIIAGIKSLWDLF